MLKSEIEFVNHASVRIARGRFGLLCDPWYEGDAFHRGWNLIFENEPSEIERILRSVSHIWISHEHPDHFSIPFFRRFGALIRELGMPILFQETRDQRVKSFIEKQGIEVVELAFDTETELAEGVCVTCLKDGFYDSGLLVAIDGEKVLNLNDCEVKTKPRAREVHAVTGEVDALLTQFSYAAWKGGEENRKWREAAAAEKLDTMRLQIETFRPRYVVPFASFVYFSNKRNFYLNDAVNHPRHVVGSLADTGAEIVLMKPYDVLGGQHGRPDVKAAVAWWEEKYDRLGEAALLDYTAASMEELATAFEAYRKRVAEKNDTRLMRALRRLSPVRVFRPINVELDDLGRTVHVDYLSGGLEETAERAHLRMSSASLLFLFKNSFGFDTLTVNGCFEEVQKGGFVLATKTLAIENLNNLGINVSLGTLFDFRLIGMFLSRLYRVARKLEA